MQPDVQNELAALDRPIPLSELARRSTAVATSVDRGFSRLWRPIPILVSGTPGAGKTMLCRSWDAAQRGNPDPTYMSTALDDLHILIRQRRWVWFDRKVRLALSVVPGQTSRNRVGGFASRLTSGHTATGAVHVVCWGYNTMWGTGDELAVVRKLSALDGENPDEDPAEVATKQARLLRDFHLGLELADLKETLRHLGASWGKARPVRTQRWLVLALAKCDLFWSELEEASAYYLGDPESKFGRLISDFQDRYGPIEVEVLPVSTGPEAWEPNSALRCRKEPEIERQDAEILMSNFYGRLETLCGIR